MSMRQIAYDIYLSQPVKITNIAIGKEGEMETLSYIPGSTLRGAVLSAMADQMAIPERKQALLSEHVQFLNAYPLCGGAQMFPSVKGFYEGKLSDGTLECVLGEKDPTPGFKRASLGEFCRADGDTVRYMSVRRTEALNNNIGANKIFRSVTLEAGQTFGGILCLEGLEDEIAETILGVLKRGGFFLGSGKTSGYGEVAIRNVREIPELPEFMPKIKAPTEDAVMILLSPMSMRNSVGEICGLDEGALAKMLGVNEVKVVKAATSAIKVSGVNRTWGCRTPEMMMYQSGSVFRLHFSPAVKPEKLEEIAEKGLGVNRSEGCGRVCFTDQYPAITRKEEILPTLPELADSDGSSQEENETLKCRLAKRMALGEMEKAMQKKIAEAGQDPWRKMSRSQRGIALNFMKNLRYKGEKAGDELRKYIEHEEEKQNRLRKQSEGDNGKKNLLERLKEIDGGDIFGKLDVTGRKVMGYSVDRLFTDSEKRDLYFRFVEMEIRYSARRAKEAD